MADTWRQRATATNAAATATKAAKANTAWVVERVLASFSNNTQVGSIEVRTGSTVLLRLNFVGSLNLTDLEIPCNINEAANVVLSAGAAGVVGDVYVQGNQIDYYA